MIIKNLNSQRKLLTLDETKKTKAGLVVLKTNEEIGKHSTENKEEVIIILEGKATVYCEGEDQKNVPADNLIYIPPLREHNIINKEAENLKYVYLVNLLEEKNEN
jgi:mannose-6-phosphate isomerase-like protein (cupin superfamily)